MTDTIDHGARIASETDEATDPPFKTLSREEAQALRASIPQVSPWRVVAAQAAAGVVCGAVTWLVTERSGAAWSALYGAATVVVPGALLARGMTSGLPAVAGRSRVGFMLWELVKIGVSVGHAAGRAEGGTRPELASVAGGDGRVHEGVLGGAAVAAPTGSDEDNRTSPIDMAADAQHATHCR